MFTNAFPVYAGFMTTADTLTQRRALIGAGILGGILGFLIGLVVDLTVWFTTMASTLANGTTISVPFFISTSTSTDVPDASATLGPGLLLLPLVTLVIGVIVASRIVTRRRG